MFSFVLLGGVYFIIKTFGILFLNMDKWMYTFILFYQLYITWLHFFEWIDDKIDVLIITSYKIKCIEQKGLFGKITSEVPLSAIHDIKIEQKTFLDNLLNYGTINIKSGMNDTISFDYIYHPVWVQQEIMKIKQGMPSEIKDTTNENINNKEKKVEKVFQIQTLPKNRHIYFQRNAIEIPEDYDQPIKKDYVVHKSKITPKLKITFDDTINLKDKLK